MRRRHLIPIAALAALAVATVASASTGGRRTASVWVSKCSRHHHAAVFHGRMRRVRGAERMRMRFTVLERVDGGDFEVVHGPGLWRARVDFRWLDEDGDVIRRARRRSGLCHQRGPLPNLRIEGIRRSAVSMYVVRVANWGRAAAHDVPVALSVDGDPVDRRIVPSVEAGEVVPVAFAGPACESGDSASLASYTTTL